MRRRDAVGHSSLPSSPQNMKREQQVMNSYSIDEGQQPQGQEAEKENRNESQKELDSFCNDYSISQNHNIKPYKKMKNLSTLKTHRFASPSCMGNNNNSSYIHSQQVSTPVNMNRIAGTSVYDSRNQRMELNNAYKLIDILKRENNQIKSKQNQDTFLIDQVGILKNDIQMKQREIEQLKIENKTLKKIKRKQESALGNHSEENKINLKIQQYQNQVLELTSNLKAEKNKNSQMERSFKKQHIFLVDIYNEYRFICSQQNLQPKIKFEKYNQMIENNNSTSNNEGSYNEDEGDQNQVRESSQKQFPDSFSSLQFQKQVSDIISMPFTQQNFMKLKEMALSYLKQLDDILSQQRKESQRQQKQLLIQQQEQQKMENQMLQQSLNKQKGNQIENNRLEYQSSDETQHNLKPLSAQYPNKNIQQKDNYNYHRNENQIPTSSRLSHRKNRPSIDIINEEDFESSQKAQHSNENRKTYSPDDISRKIESDSGHRGTNFVKSETTQNRGGLAMQEGMPKVQKKQKPQLTLNSKYLNDQGQDFNQNDEGISEISMSSKIQVNLREAFVGEKYYDIDSRDFNDRTVLKRKYNLKIVSISIYLNKELQVINGIRCDYADVQDIYTKEQKTFKGKDNVFSSESSQKVKVQMDNGDFLQNISVLYDKEDKLIRQITFISARKKAYIAGEVDPNDKKLQKQQLDINNDEYPVCIFGTLKPISKQKSSQKVNNGYDCISSICCIGFQIGSDDFDDIQIDDNQITRTVNQQ